MEQQFRAYLDGVFKNAPKTAKVLELKEELLSNLTEKYNGLISRGINEEEAFEAVKNSVGDIDGLIAEASGGSERERHEKYVRGQKKRAVLRSIAVMLYIVCPVPLIAMGMSGHSIWGLFSLFACIAVATGIMVYTANFYPKYERSDDTVVEEMREKNAEKGRKKENKLVSIMWMVITVIYFVISFMTMAWHITWIIFIVGAILAKVIEMLTDEQ